jgi:branched-chain amino acid transport system permease protein
MKSFLRQTPRLALGSFVFVLLILPLFADPYVLHVMIIIFFFAYLGSTWNILGGYAGQFSFGHAALVGIGAYTSSILFVKLNISPWLGLLAGCFVGMIFGFFTGLITFHYKLKGIYFSFATLAFAELLKLIFLNWDFVGGAVGILIPLQGNSISQFQFLSKVPYYYISMFMAFGIIFLTWKLEKSKLGDFFKAVREDEDTAESLGVDKVKYKLIAICIASALAPAAGSFYAQYLTYIQPNFILGVEISIQTVITVIIGGIGTVWGPILGAFILGPASEITRIFLQKLSSLHLVIYGIILVVSIMYFPSGVIGGLRKLLGSRDV